MPTESSDVCALAEPGSNEDPLVTHSRREAIVALVAWFVSMLFVVGYCRWFGYDRDVQSLKFILGFPDWVFLGVIVPWVVSTAFSAWFALRFMADDPLGEERAEDAQS